MNEPHGNDRSHASESRLDARAAEIVRQRDLAERRCEFEDERNDLLFDLVSAERLSDEESTYLRDCLNDLIPQSNEREPMIATAEVNGKAVSTFRARVVAIESAERFIDHKQRATLAVEDCDPTHRDIRFPIPESLELELDDVLAVSIEKVA